MSSTRKRAGAARRTGIALAAGAAMLFAGPAAAQLGGGDLRPRGENAQNQRSGVKGLHPPPPARPDNPPRALYYVLILVLGGATIAVGIMPSKRGHTD